MVTSVNDPRVKAYIEETVGPEGMKLAQLLESKQSATDSQLAEELGQKPSHIRKILYDLYEARIAEYKKEKDKETGWLTFYWNISAAHAQYAMGQKRKREIGELEERLRAEEGHDWFICPEGHERFDFNSATEQDFHCPAHGAILQAHDNADLVREIKHRIHELRSAMEKEQAEG